MQTCLCYCLRDKVGLFKQIGLFYLLLLRPLAQKRRMKDNHDRAVGATTAAETMDFVAAAAPATDPLFRDLRFGRSIYEIGR